MFDQRKFWLATAVFVFIIGGVIATVGAAFNTFIGMPAKNNQSAVTQAPIPAAVGRVSVERGVATPALPLSPLVARKQATDFAGAMPQIAVPAPLIVPERRR